MSWRHGDCDLAVPRQCRDVNDVTKQVYILRRAAIMTLELVKIPSITNTISSVLISAQVLRPSRVVEDRSTRCSISASFDHESFSKPDMTKSLVLCERCTRRGGSRSVNAFHTGGPFYVSTVALSQMYQPPCFNWRVKYTSIFSGSHTY